MSLTPLQSEMISELFAITKQAAQELDSAHSEIARLKSEGRQETPAPVFTKESADKWAAALKKASLVDENTPVDKLAAYILKDPAWLVDNLLNSQLPPEEQGHQVVTKQASRKTQLVDHDGWLGAIGT